MLTLILKKAKRNSYNSLGLMIVSENNTKHPKNGNTVYYIFHDIFFSGYVKSFLNCHLFRR